jgi:hypothetical protein
MEDTFASGVLNPVKGFKAAAEVNGQVRRRNKNGKGKAKPNCLGTSSPHHPLQGLVEPTLDG